MKKVIRTKNSSLPIAPYNQGILTEGTLYISGQISVNPATGELVKETIEAEAHQVMHNIKGILEEAGMSFANVVKTSIFITDMKNFASVNKVYASYFSSDFPARETVQVAGLPLDVNVEISAIAVA